MSKKYGLIKPDKNKPTFQASRNIFGDGSDSEDDTSKKPVRPSHNSTRMAALTQEKALAEDPSVYQYDEIYDSMAEKKAEEKAKTKVDTKPKYIEKLLKTAQKRKIENERRIERQVQKEREKEGNEFADKEVFVTSAYKKKLEEMRQEEEQEKREEYLESIGDVTKQRDLGGFYRHLYEQRMGVESKKDVSPEKISKSSENQEKDNSKKSIKRNYRKRVERDSNDSAVSDNHEEIDVTDKLQSAKKPRNDANIDADSDFSIDDSSSDEEKGKENSKNRDEIKTPEIHKKDADLQIDKVKKDDKKDKKKDKKDDVIQQPKIDIWKKRTVGAVFDEALKRFYQRKATKA